MSEVSDAVADVKDAIREILDERRILRDKSAGDFVDTWLNAHGKIVSKTGVIMIARPFNKGIRLFGFAPNGEKFWCFVPKAELAMVRIKLVTQIIAGELTCLRTVH